MKGTSRIGSSPIANAARHGSAAATTAATMIPIGHHRGRDEPDHQRAQPRGGELERERHRDHRHAGDPGADDQAQQGDVPPAAVGRQRQRAGREREHAGCPPSAGAAGRPGRRARPQTMLPPIAPTPAASSIAAACAERQVPLVGEVRHDERDQEEVEQVEHRARPSPRPPARRSGASAAPRRAPAGTGCRAGVRGLLRRGPRRARAASARAAAPASASTAPDQLHPEAGLRLGLAGLDLAS